MHLIIYYTLETIIYIQFRTKVERLYSEHPRNEHDTVLRMDRLLGQLMPLRAFGDFRFKWSRNVLEKYVSPVVGESALPPNYKTPPYLTARPEIVQHTLTPRDKFLVIASDGLWDLLSPTQVARLVPTFLKFMLHSALGFFIFLFYQFTTTRLGWRAHVRSGSSGDPDPSTRRCDS